MDNEYAFLAQLPKVVAQSVTSTLSECRGLSKTCAQLGPPTAFESVQRSAKRDVHYRRLHWYSKVVVRVFHPRLVGSYWLQSIHKYYHESLVATEIADATTEPLYFCLETETGNGGGLWNFRFTLP